MVFSSHVFIFYFLPITLLLYYMVPRRGKHVVLTLLSYFFYGWTNPYFIFLILASTVIDYICGLVMTGQLFKDWSKPLEPLEKGGARSKKQRYALFVSVFFNLSLLGFFKYFNFGLDSYNALMSTLGMDFAQWELFLRITLPLGISFYTFQSMSYTIDIYRGDAKAIRNFTDFACYVSMFPQLVAGPIIRFSEVDQQLEHRTHTVEKFARGVAFFAMGMAKKILLANPMGMVADTTFSAGSLATLDAWFGAIAGAFQIYFDFSGYSDMAIGLGLMLGFTFPKNFNRPFFARSITNYWQRWHLSLSVWLRNYLYYPLGGSKKGVRRTYVNLATVMLLGGLWHGAAWTFVAWAAVHATVLVAERLNGKKALYHFLPVPMQMACTFIIAMVARVFFRSTSVGEALRYLGNMIGLGNVQSGADLVTGVIYQPYYIFILLLAGYIVWFARDTWDYTKKLSLAKSAYIMFLFVLSLMVMTTQAYNPFIYFIF